MSTFTTHRRTLVSPRLPYGRGTALIAGSFTGLINDVWVVNALIIQCRHVRIYHGIHSGCGGFLFITPRICTVICYPESPAAVEPLPIIPQGPVNISVQLVHLQIEILKIPCLTFKLTFVITYGINAVVFYFSLALCCCLHTIIGR